MIQNVIFDSKCNYRNKMKEQSASKDGRVFFRSSSLPKECTKKVKLVFRDF